MIESKAIAGIRALFVLAFLIHVTSADAGLLWEDANQELAPAKASAKQAEVHFKFKNAGNETVKIVSVKTSCGCVHSGLQRNVFAPGESGEVTATLIFGDRVGLQEKSVVVQTDDPKEPMKILTMRLSIAPALEVTPALVFWRLGEKTEPKEITVKVSDQPEGEKPTVTSSSPEVEVSLERGEERGLYKILVSPKTTAKALTAFVRIETQGDDSKSVVAHVRIK